MNILATIFLLIGLLILVIPLLSNSGYLNWLHPFIHIRLMYLYYYYPWLVIILSIGCLLFSIELFNYDFTQKL